MSENKLKPLFLFILFSFFSALLIYGDEGFNYNFNLLTINFIICVISLYLIFVKTHYKFSLYQIIHLFFLFFFGIAPALQYKNDSQFWGSLTKITEDEYIVGNFFTLSSLIIFNVLHNFLLKRRIDITSKNKKEIKITKGLRLHSFKLISISFIALVIFLFSKNFDFFSIFLRGSFNSTKSSAITNSSLSLIVNNFIRPIPAVVLFSYKFFKKNNKFTFAEFIMLILMLICDFPLGMPRFLAATLYIPLLLVYSKVFRKHYNFALFFCLGLLVIFPFLDQFRHAKELSTDTKIGISTQMFSEGTFDSYQNTINVINKADITYGRQLLGVLFFYVPRSIWSTKPIGSGAYIAKEFKYNFSNISMNFLGEGYLNFGYFGVFLFILFLSNLVSRFDFMYWNNLIRKEYMYIIYFYLYGLLFFIMRGDLLSSFAYTIGLSSAIYLVLKYATK